MLFDAKLGDDLWLTYATPILVRRHADKAALNEGLCRILLDRESQSSPLTGAEAEHSNVGGWRSGRDLLGWPEPEIATLKSLIQEAVVEVMRQSVAGEGTVRARLHMEGWASINRDRGYHVPHTHPGSHWSGVYYVAAGEPDPAYPASGRIAFQDPRSAAMTQSIPGFDFGQSRTIAPEPGMLLLFPAWMPHMVHPFYGQGARIAISFNVRVNEFSLGPPPAPAG